MNTTEFMCFLRLKRHILSRQEYKVLKGQAVSGDVVGAIKGLNKLIRRAERNGELANGR